VTKNAEEPRRFRRRDNTLTRRYLKVIGRRADFLKDRIENFYPALAGEDPSSHDKAEEAALRWAISTIGQWVAEDPVAREEQDADDRKADGGGDQVRR
jgi:hypothetical protein